MRAKCRTCGFWTYFEGQCPICGGMLISIDEMLIEDLFGSTDK